MQLENLRIGTLFAVPELGIEEARLDDLNSGYAKVTILKGIGQGSGARDWAPATIVQPLRKVKSSEVSSVPNPQSGYKGRTETPVKPVATLAPASKPVTVALEQESIMTATTTKTAAPKTSKAKPAANGKAATNGHVKKDGLRKPQVRILAFLAKCKAPVARKLIAEKAPADLACLVEWIGSDDEEKRARNDTKLGGFPCLLTLKAVKAKAAQEENGGTEYEITATGRQLLEKALKG